MKKIFYFGIFLILCNFIPMNAIAEVNVEPSINTTATISWPFDLGTAGQVATFSTGTDVYFSQNYVSLGSNLAYKDASTKDNVYTRFQFAVQNNSAGIDDVASFNIRPKTGLKFTPTFVAFDCMRYGTDGGFVDVAWKSTDGTITSLQTAIKPARDNTGAGTHVSIDLSTLSIPASDGECALYIYVYGLASSKQGGLADIVIDGKVEGAVLDIPTHKFITSVFPIGAGSIAANPVGNEFDEGTEISLTANRNFGYTFSHWANAADEQLSTENPYTVTLSADMTLKAVFAALNTYSLAINIDGGGKDYMIAVSPAGTIVDGVRMYEEGANVTLTADNNPLLTFTNWLSDETNAELVVNMSADKTVTAVYSVVDYIVGWDFYKAGSNGRSADFYSNDDNQTASLIKLDPAGTTLGWLDKAIAPSGGYEGKGAAVNWSNLTDKTYYQMSFNATDFTDITIQSSMLQNYNAYSLQNMEYSLDGTTFTKLGSVSLASSKVWYPSTITLPAIADHASKVYFRWMPDFTSEVLGTASEKDGTSLAEIYVFGKTAVLNDGTAPVLSSSVPDANGIGASTTGKIVLTFDEKVQIAVGTTATVGTKTLNAAVSGKTITFAYTGLEYNTEYTFTLAANKVSDLGANTLTTPISFKFSTMNRPVVTKKGFDFVVGVDGDFKAALDAAKTASSTGNRFYIFFPDGQYNIGANTGDSNQKTTITLPNVSYIGESSEGVVLYNQNTSEGIGVTATVNFTNTANNLYLQDLSLKNNDFRSGKASLGRCVALQDQGTKNTYKNVNVQSNQDTYFSGSGRLYFEGGSIHGTVDYICGGGDIFFNECLLYLEERTGNCITAPATSSQWGYVFNGCTIDGSPVANGNFNLGRPWQNSPKSIYINTKMNILPSAGGWTEMGVVPGLFAEYNSMTASGSAVDVSARKKSFTYSGVTTPVNPYLTAEQAATYTIENVLGGTDAWQPTLYTDQATAPVIVGEGSTINWANNDYVLCWAVLKDGKFEQFVTTNSYTIPSTVTSANYSVRAANEMGGLGNASNEYNFNVTAVHDVKNNAELVELNYFTLEGRKLRKIEGYKGIVIVRSTYSDGHIYTSKIIKTEY